MTFMLCAQSGREKEKEIDRQIENRQIDRQIEDRQIDRYFRVKGQDTLGTQSIVSKVKIMKE